jgi:hypothetical protein
MNKHKNSNEYRKDKRIAKIYNKYYRGKNIKDGLQASKLVRDRIDKISYPIKPGKYNIIQKSLFEILNAYIYPVPFDKERYQSVIDSILTMQKDKSCLILFNHDNFATMTAFIKELYDHA